MTVPEIASSIGQSRQIVQNHVNTLREVGFVRVKENPDHKRVKLVALTSKGKKRYQNIEAIYTPQIKQCVDHISVGNLNTTLITLKKISDLFER